jgi:hypothetical protein
LLILSVVGMTFTMVLIEFVENTRVAALCICVQYEAPKISIYKERTRRTVNKSPSIFHSCSNLQRFRDFSAVIASTAQRYLTANRSMSNVLFQRVLTS